MNKPDFRKSTERLLILWVLSLVLVSFCKGILWIVLQLDTGLMSLEQLVVTLFVAFFSLPLLFKLHKTAKLAEMKAINTFALVMIVQHFLWISMSIIGTVCALIWPEIVK